MKRIGGTQPKDEINFRYLEQEKNETGEKKN